MVKGLSGRHHEAFGITRVFGQENGGFGVLGPNTSDRFDDAFLQIRGTEALGGHIGQAIQHVHLGIDFVDEVDDFGFQTSIARKTEVDHRTIQFARQNIGPGHTWARGTGALRNGSAIHNNRFFLHVGQRGKLTITWHTDFQSTQPFVQWQVQAVFPAEFVVAIGGFQLIEVVLHGILEAVFSGTKMPGSVAVNGVQIHAAYPGSGHVGHAGAADNLITYLDLGGIAKNTDKESSWLER